MRSATQTRCVAPGPWLPCHCRRCTQRLPPSSPPPPSSWTRRVGVVAALMAVWIRHRDRFRGRGGRGHRAGSRSARRRGPNRRAAAPPSRCRERGSISRSSRGSPHSIARLRISKRASRSSRVAVELKVVVRQRAIDVYEHSAREPDRSGRRKRFTRRRTPQPLAEPAQA